MKTVKRRSKCLHCKEVFTPDYRNRGRQAFCNKSECRRVSKSTSQAAWLAKEENKNYFKGPSHVARVQQWRKGHPGYWKRAAKKTPEPLQETCSEQNPPNQAVAQNKPTHPLQDLCSLQVPLFAGLISALTGNTLQEDIVQSARNIVAKGHDILGMVPGISLERFHEKTCPQSGATPESSRSVQLDRSPAGAGKLLQTV